MIDPTLTTAWSADPAATLDRAAALIRAAAQRRDPSTAGYYGRIVATAVSRGLIGSDRAALALAAARKAGGKL